MTSRRGWTAADIPDQSGRTAVVTGASAGLGLETARVLAGCGGTVVLACRDMRTAALAAGRIRADAAARAGPGAAGVRVVHLDLASPAPAVGGLRAAHRGDLPHPRVIRYIGNEQPPMTTPR
jgi:NAD(P)-dependent dehydrogenase (short-subunit alcohol dehydrogenase family)